MACLLQTKKTNHRQKGGVWQLIRIVLICICIDDVQKQVFSLKNVAVWDFCNDSDGSCTPLTLQLDSLLWNIWNSTLDKVCV